GEHARAWLGVYSQEFTAALRDGLDYKGDGVLVNRVVPQSPADRAGLRNGDVIVRLNSRPVRTPEDLSNLVQAGRPGQSVALEIVRDGERRTLNAKLAARPSDDDQTWVRDRGDDRGEDPEARAVPEAPDAPDMSDAPDARDAPDAPDPPAPPRAPRAPRAPMAPRVFRFETAPRDFPGMFMGRG